jgi:hypothetical protein
MDPFYESFGLGKKLVDIEEEKEKRWEHRCVKAKVMATLGPATCKLDEIMYNFRAFFSFSQFEF